MRHQVDASLPSLVLLSKTARWYPSSWMRGYPCAELLLATAGPRAARFAATPELETALTSLSAGEREVLALRIVLELDGDAAARVLGISPTAVSTRLSRALKRLEERVNEG